MESGLIQPKCESKSFSIIKLHKPKVRNQLIELRLLLYIYQSPGTTMYSRGYQSSK